MKISILEPKFALNILIHVAILFTILLLFFIKIISHLASDAINKELEHVINNAFKNIKKENLLDKNFPELSKLKNRVLSEIPDLSELSKLPKLSEIPELGINDSLDYFLNLFSKEDNTRYQVNNELFDKIKIVNIIIVAFVFIIGALFVYNNIVSIDEIKHILIDNIVTFIFVGIVEVLFFLNIALKFIPAPPSLIFTSFISSFKKNK